MYSTYFPVTYYFYPLLEAQLDTQRLEAIFAQPVAADIETLLYVHIPYCQDMCRFCPFHVRVDKDVAIYERYTQALCLDIQRTAASARGASSTLKAIYFGGGSPSVLSAEQIARILDCIAASFSIDPAVEISFEGEPKTLGDPERLEVLKRHGVQRISFGLQTYEPSLRSHFNIAATLDDIERVRRNGREFAFDEINVDMMYNLPGQTLGSLEQDIRRLVEDDFDSIDYYNLHYFAFPPKFKRQMAEGSIPPKPSEPMMLALFEQMRHSLERAGYDNVADQVYSRKGRVCEYFRLLWGGGAGEHRAETLAVGSSARGYVDGCSYMLHGNVNKYMEGIEAGVSVVEKTSAALGHPENRGAVMFPKFLRIDKAHQAALATIPPELLASWIEHGLLYETDQAFHISERGKLWNNNMTTDLFEAAQRQVGDEAVIALVNKAGTRTGSF
ncbi:coproporphyrinogen-III oxidase family protein [Pseudomonas sp. NCHU5208]|uniref:coproporphyrinogen-III oxidase family protein n=1 Tax=unclassified Pseudomonas TaxID=196821 RepID=UPI003F973C5A